MKKPWSNFWQLFYLILKLIKARFFQTILKSHYVCHARFVILCARICFKSLFLKNNEVVSVTIYAIQLHTPWIFCHYLSLLIPLLLTRIVYSQNPACYASCWPKMTIDCSATAFVIRLRWILHLNHFIIYVPNSCQCHLEAGWLVIHHTLSFTVVINIVMGWTFTMKLPGEGNADLFREGQATQNKSTSDRLSCVATIKDRLSGDVVRGRIFPVCTVPFTFTQGRSQKNVGCYSFFVLFHQDFNHLLPITHRPAQGRYTKSHNKTRL